MYYRIAAISTFLFLSASAQADVILMLDDGMGNVVTIADNNDGTDGNPMDGDMTDGVVTFNGGLGTFMVNVSTGFSAPLVGGPLEPILHLNSVDVSGAAAGSITIGLTATDFLGPFGDTNFGLFFGGVTHDEVVVEAYVDSTNAAWGKETLLSSLSSDDDPGAAFGINDYGPVNIAASPFSLSLFTTITHDSAFDISSFDAELRIPEPGTLGIFGFGLLLLGMTRKRIPVQLR